MSRARLFFLAVFAVAVLCGAARRRAVRHPSPPVIELVDIAGSAIAGAEDGPAASARFSSPRGIAFDSATRSIVVADTANHTIRKIQNGQVTTIAGAALQNGSADGAATTARFRLPHGVAIDARGRIWICDTANHVIRRIEEDGSVSTVAGSAGNAGDVDGAARSARFRFPEGIAIENGSSVVIADTGNHKLRRIADDNVTTIATAAPLRSPSGVAIDTDGTLIVADREADATGVAVFAGAPYVADGCNHTIRALRTGKTVADGLRFPYALAAGDGELLIADTRHHTIRALRGLR